MLGVRVCVCRAASAHSISHGNEGNALYPVLSSQYCEGVTVCRQLNHLNVTSHKDQLGLLPSVGR